MPTSWRQSPPPRHPPSPAEPPRRVDRGDQRGRAEPQQQRPWRALPPALDPRLTPPPQRPAPDAGVRSAAAVARGALEGLRARVLPVTPPAGGGARRRSFDTAPPYASESAPTPPEVHSAGERAAAAERERDEALGRLNGMKRIMAQVQEDAAAVGQANAELSAQVGSLAAQCAVLREEGAAAGAEHARLRGEIRQLGLLRTAEQDAAGAALADANAKLAAAEQALGAESARRARAEADLAESSAALAALQGQGARRESADADLAALRQQLHDSLEAARGSRRASEACADELQRMQEELQAAEEELERERAARGAAEAAVEERRAAEESVRAELGLALQQLNALQSSEDECRRQLEETLVSEEEVRRALVLEISRRGQHDEPPDDEPASPPAAGFITEQALSERCAVLSAEAAAAGELLNTAHAAVVRRYARSAAQLRRIAASFGERRSAARALGALHLLRQRRSAERVRALAAEKDQLAATCDTQQRQLREAQAVAAAAERRAADAAEGGAAMQGEMRELRGELRELQRSAASLGRAAEGAAAAQERGTELAEQVGLLTAALDAAARRADEAEQQRAELPRALERAAVAERRCSELERALQRAEARAAAAAPPPPPQPPAAPPEEAPPALPEWVNAARSPCSSPRSPQSGASGRESDLALIRRAVSTLRRLSAEQAAESDAGCSSATEGSLRRSAAQVGLAQLGDAAAAALPRAAAHAALEGALDATASLLRRLRTDDVRGPRRARRRSGGAAQRRRRETCGGGSDGGGAEVADISSAASSPPPPPRHHQQTLLWTREGAGSAQQQQQQQQQRLEQELRAAERLVVERAAECADLQRRAAAAEGALAAQQVAAAQAERRAQEAAAQLADCRTELEEALHARCDSRQMEMQLRELSARAEALELELEEERCASERWRHSAHAAESAMAESGLQQGAAHGHGGADWGDEAHARQGGRTCGSGGGGDGEGDREWLLELLRVVRGPASPPRWGGSGDEAAGGETLASLRHSAMGEAAALARRCDALQGELAQQPRARRPPALRSSTASPAEPAAAGDGAPPLPPFDVETGGELPHPAYRADHWPCADRRPDAVAGDAAAGALQKAAAALRGAGGDAGRELQQLLSASGGAAGAALRAAAREWRNCVPEAWRGRHPEAALALAAAFCMGPAAEKGEQWAAGARAGVDAALRSALAHVEQEGGADPSAAEEAAEGMSGLARVFADCCAALPLAAPAPGGSVPRCYRAVRVHASVARDHQLLAPGNQYGWAAAGSCTFDQAEAEQQAAGALLFTVEGAARGVRHSGGVLLPPLSLFRVDGVRLSADGGTVCVALTWLGTSAESAASGADTEAVTAAFPRGGSSSPHRAPPGSPIGERARADLQRLRLQLSAAATELAEARRSGAALSTERDQMARHCEALEAVATESRVEAAAAEGRCEEAERRLAEAELERGELRRASENLRTELEATTTATPTVAQTPAGGGLLGEQALLLWRAWQSAAGARRCAVDMRKAVREGSARPREAAALLGMAEETEEATHRAVGVLVNPAELQRLREEHEAGERQCPSADTG